MESIRDGIRNFEKKKKVSKNSQKFLFSFNLKYIIIN